MTILENFLLNYLVEMELDEPCEKISEYDDCYCEKYCNFSYPQKECWLKFIKYKIKEGYGDE